MTQGRGTPGAPCSTRPRSPRGPGLWELADWLGGWKNRSRTLKEPREGAGPAPAAPCIAPRVGAAPQAPQDNTEVDPDASSTDPGEQLTDTENPNAVGHHCWSGLLRYWGQGWPRGSSWAGREVRGCWCSTDGKWAVPGQQTSRWQRQPCCRMQDWPFPTSLSFYQWLGGAQSPMFPRWHHRATTIQLSWCRVPLHLAHHRISANESLVAPGMWSADPPALQHGPQPCYQEPWSSLSPLVLGSCHHSAKNPSS